MGVRSFNNIGDIVISENSSSRQKQNEIFKDYEESCKAGQEENFKRIDFGQHFENGDTLYSEDDFKDVWRCDLKSDDFDQKKDKNGEKSVEMVFKMKNEVTKDDKNTTEDEIQVCEDFLCKNRDNVRSRNMRLKEDTKINSYKEVKKSPKSVHLNSVFSSLKGNGKLVLFVCLAASLSVAAGFPFMGNLPPQHFFDTYKCGCKGNADESRSFGLLKRGRVVGGDEVPPGSAPWLAALTKDSGPHCGATLISKKHLLTAAHCIDGIELAELDAWIGAHSLSQAAAGSGSYKIIRAWSHPTFDIFTFTNDIAVLELAQEVTFSSTIRPICLPSRDDAEYSRRTAIVAGWGRTSEQKPPSDVPRQAQVQIWGAARCKNSGYPVRRVSGPVLCAGLSKGGVDACQGDSGGPLILPGSEGVIEVIGVVSWGRGCARPNLPGVYTRVASFLPFIHGIIDETCS